VATERNQIITDDETCGPVPFVQAGTVGPFGGFKMSGLGRACSIEGIEAFLETKRVSIGI
jgi:acyl-CoA reductase-like NAD-dependent aldehyde dehydrogenase